MTKRRRTQAGVTLLELLIAVTLVSLISTGILYAMSVGLKALDKTGKRFDNNRRVLGVDRAMRQQIGGLIPLPVECGGAGAPAGKALFFQGELQSMRFVSNYSLEESSRGYARILEYAVIPGENSVGVRLIVNEELYTGPFSLRGYCLGMQPDPATGAPVPVFRPIAAMPRSFVLADKLASCRFLFRSEEPLPLLERWWPRWAIAKWPTAVRVEIVPLEPNPAGLTVQTLTIPIHVDPEAYRRYED